MANPVGGDSAWMTRAEAEAYLKVSRQGGSRPHGLNEETRGVEQDSTDDATSSGAPMTPPENDPTSVTASKLTALVEALATLAATLYAEEKL